jgi:hypothetical protein
MSRDPEIDHAYAQGVKEGKRQMKDLQTEVLINALDTLTIQLRASGPVSARITAKDVAEVLKAIKGALG